jgi:hypothetical protein
MEKLTATIISEYQNRRSKLKTIGEFKALGRELRDRFGLTDREAIDLMNGNNEIEFMSKQHENGGSQ